MRRSWRKENQVMGIGGYRPGQWQRLREVSVDVEVLEETCADGLAFATQRLRDLRHHGISLIKVDVDVEELVGRCDVHHRRVDAGARAEFILRKLQEAGGDRGKLARAKWPKRSWLYPSKKSTSTSR